MFNMSYSKVVNYVGVESLECTYITTFMIYHGNMWNIFLKFWNVVANVFLIVKGFEKIWKWHILEKF
jgi:hypothetical protein